MDRLAGAVGEGSPEWPTAARGVAAGIEACEACGGRASSSSRSPPAGCASASEACRDDVSTCVGSDCADVRRLSLQDAVTVDEGGAGGCPRTPRSARADALEVGAGSRLNRSMLAAALGSVLVSWSLQGGGRPHVDMGFNAQSEPRITVHAYLRRLSDHLGCSDGCLLAGLVYIDRVGKMRPAFVVSPLNVHRVVLASLVLAAKFWDDRYYTNRRYAEVGGVRLQVMNSLEREFLRLIRWRLTISPEEFQIYQNIIFGAVRQLRVAQRSV